MKNTAKCPECRYSARLRKDGTIGRHLLYSGSMQFACRGEGKRPYNIMKFGEMPYGQWFRELRSDDPRVFVKIQNVLPSGIQVLYMKKVAKDHFFLSGEKMDSGGKIINGYFNSIDLDGIPGTCPDWVEFELIDPPYGHKQIEHSQGCNLDLPRYDGDTYQGPNKRSF